MTDPVRIVVAEGTPSRKGFLRFVLEGEGYDVVGEASNPAELARSVSVHDPDVVVMDGGIGATSVGMIHDLAPASKVILVWPGAVMPIGGDARVEPSNVLRELGLAVEGLTGVACATSLAAAAGGALAGPRDAATLREVLARGEAAQAHRPAEPGPATADGSEGAAAAAAGAAVGAAAIAATVGAPGAGAAAVPAAAAPAAAADATATALNRKLGTIALSGAAAAGALVLALALGGSRVPVASISGTAAEPSTPGIGQPSISPVVPGGEVPGGEGSGETPGGQQGGDGSRTHSRGGNEPLCDYYLETCLPPAGPTGTGGLSMGDIYGHVEGGVAAAPKSKRDAGGRSPRSTDRGGGSKPRDGHGGHHDQRGRHDHQGGRDPKGRHDRKGEAA